MGTEVVVGEILNEWHLVVWMRGGQKGEERPKDLNGNEQEGCRLGCKGNKAGTHPMRGEWGGGEAWDFCWIPKVAGPRFFPNQETRRGWGGWRCGGQEGRKDKCPRGGASERIEGKAREGEGKEGTERSGWAWHIDSHGKGKRREKGEERRREVCGAERRSRGEEGWGPKKKGRRGYKMEVDKGRGRMERPALGGRRGLRGAPADLERVVMEGGEGGWLQEKEKSENDCAMVSPWRRWSCGRAISRDGRSRSKAIGLKMG
ncbi:hypothetical protein AMTR_s00045p00226090 [Amborella trichopoda]|uniref:Uncharacterized protein n=1 Tax=Amborella trichopoda TaxID=13333 RepID=W1NXB2_AMBTC|nr:hypothetical protein AMTR_s00045p00226090 [Amborella trichopoda]